LTYPCKGLSNYWLNQHSFFDQLYIPFLILYLCVIIQYTVIRKSLNIAIVPMERNQKLPMKEYAVPLHKNGVTVGAIYFNYYLN
jgi:hypothetical protein